MPRTIESNLARDVLNAIESDEYMIAVITRESPQSVVVNMHTREFPLNFIDEAIKKFKVVAEGKKRDDKSA